jgi:hypothetical protein
MRRLYLRDGDAGPDEQATLSGTASKDGKKVPMVFLERAEIENYLLKAEPITAAIRTLKDFEGSAEQHPSVAEIEAYLHKLVHEEYAASFGDEKGDPWKRVKGFKNSYENL